MDIYGYKYTVYAVLVGVKAVKAQSLIAWSDERMVPAKMEPCWLKIYKTHFPLGP